MLHRKLRNALAAALAVVAALASGSASRASTPAADDVVKATLRNGLRVVIVRDSLAPVIATDMTYLVGSRDDPPRVPGMAHAQEHMMFRGTPNLSTAELGTLATALGGDFNASTSDTLTQYQFTVPASDFDAVLRIEADRMRDLSSAQAEWQNERGAIEQEVLRDESSPGNDFFREARALAFAGTPYAHEGVGTRSAFDRLTGPQIKAFHERWYHPNNAVFVVSGDVDAANTLAQIRARFESIPPRVLPAHTQARFAPLQRVVLRRRTALVYALAAVGFRLPGIDSPDFLPSYVFQDVLNSQRGPLHALADSGEALDGSWVSLPYVPEAQLGFATAALPPGADPMAMTERLQSILNGYAERGVPSELFEASKRRLIASQELSRNSLSALASDWATTIALDRQPSIAREQRLISGVSLAAVDRVAKRYFGAANAIVGALTPSAGASQSAAPAPPAAGPEKPLETQAAVTHLPAWAQRYVERAAVPPARLAATRATLSNGITLIVEPQTISDSVLVFGSVRTNAALQEPAGKEGVASVLAGMFGYGTETRDRASFQRAADDIDTSLSAGADFGMQTIARSFGRGVDLLAENELSPRLDEATFELVRRRVADELATSSNSLGTAVERRIAQKLLPAGDPELRQATSASLQALTLSDVRDYYRQTLRPDLTTIVVAGNVTVQAARSAIERALGGWRATSDAPVPDLPALPPNEPADVTLSAPSLRQTDVSYEQIVPIARAAPDFYALQLGNAILGGGALGPEQSRLFRDIRQSRGLAYSIASQFTAQHTRSRFSVRFACLPENARRIGALVDDEIEKMRTQPVGPFELALMKASLVRRSVIADASLGAIGNALLGHAMDGLPLDQGHLDAARYAATDAPAVQRAFAAYVRPRNFVRVFVGP